MNIISIKDRLRRRDMIQTYELLSDKVAIDCAQFFKPSDEGRTREHRLKLEMRRSNLLLRSKFFSNRVVAAWNKLPEEMATLPTVNGFKNGLDQLWAIKP